MTAKDLLRHETDRAFDCDEMSLLSAVRPYDFGPHTDWKPVRNPAADLSTEAARLSRAGWHRTIWQIIEHVADCKVMYMTQAFGAPPEDPPAPGETLDSLLAYLQACHEYLVTCLESSTAETLASPVPVCHGETLANRFWVLAQHDVVHGSQIEVLRQTPAAT
jgi:hypothetical protein